MTEVFEGYVKRAEREIKELELEVKAAVTERDVEEGREMLEMWQNELAVAQRGLERTRMDQTVTRWRTKAHMKERTRAACVRKILDKLKQNRRGEQEEEEEEEKTKAKRKSKRKKKKKREEKLSLKLQIELVALCNLSAVFQCEHHQERKKNKKKCKIGKEMAWLLESPAKSPSAETWLEERRARSSLCPCTDDDVLAPLLDLFEDRCQIFFRDVTVPMVTWLRSHNPNVLECLGHPEFSTPPRGLPAWTMLTNLHEHVAAWRLDDAGTTLVGSLETVTWPGMRAWAKYQNHQAIS